MKNCEDFALNSFIYQRWKSSVDYREQNIVHHNNKLCLFEDAKTVTYANSSPNEQDKNEWYIKIKYCEEMDNNNQCDTQILQNKVIWVGYNFPFIQLSISNYTQPIILSFEEERLSRMEKNSYINFH